MIKTVIKPKKKVLLIKSLKITLVIFIVIILLLEGLSIYIVHKFSHPKISKLHSNIANYGISDYEKVTFNSSKKDVKLNGYLFKTENSKKTVIICHGYGDNKYVEKTEQNVKNDNIKLSKLFLKYGYNALIFDFRGHGDSEGAGVTIGYNEQQDLLGAIDFVKSKKLGDEIGAIGFSMGAATVLSVVNKTNDLNFVIADSPFSDLKDYLNANMSLWTGLPNFISPMVLANFKLYYGVNFNEISPMKSVLKSDIPILLIHGKNDTTIPYSESIKIEKNLKNKDSKLVLFNDCTHVGAFSSNPKKYEDVLKNFFDKMQ